VLQRKSIIPIFSYLFFISVLSAMAGGDNFTTPTQNVTIRDLFPLEKGFRWRYTHDTREGTSHYSNEYLGVVTKDGKPYNLLGNPFGVSYFEITPDIIYLRAVAPGEDIENAQFYKGGEMVRLMTPLESGHRWGGKAWVEKEGQPIITAYATEIIGWSKVEVPAGAFDCLVTSSTLNTIFVREKGMVGVGSLAQDMIWYSPGIGIVRRLKYLLYPNQPQELLSDDKLEEFIH
jgi:hypothetical protein